MRQVKIFFESANCTFGEQLQNTNAPLIIQQFDRSRMANLFRSAIFLRNRLWTGALMFASDLWAVSYSTLLTLLGKRGIMLMTLICLPSDYRNCCNEHFEAISVRLPLQIFKLRNEIKQNTLDQHYQSKSKQ